MTERRYAEEEVREIFARAAQAGGDASNLPTHGEGWTLGELQAAGREAGLSAERVARAAASLDAAPEILPRRTLLGFPASVGRIVNLPREATAREWEFLVSELRATFDAKGEVRVEGGVREWSNGNLHAVLEHTRDGHRLRLGTRKGDVFETTLLGIMGLVMALIVALVLVAEARTGAMFLPAVMGLAGAGMLGANALRLPRWASERERQMAHLAAWTRDLLDTPLEDEAPREEGSREAT